jgi:hypothetical protein
MTNSNGKSFTAWRAGLDAITDPVEKQMFIQQRVLENLEHVNGCWRHSSLIRLFQYKENKRTSSVIPSLTVKNCKEKMPDRK